MKFKFSMAAIIVLCAATSLGAQEIKGAKFGKGLLNIKAQDSSWSMKVGLRMQILSEASWDHDNEKISNPSSDFTIRRARLKFDGFAFSPKLEYKIELGLSNSDLSGGSVYTSNTPRYILDAVGKWNFYKNFTLWFGQTKLPGNRERVISSANMQMVDRSLLNSQFNIDRDMGLQLHHNFNLTKNFVVKEVLAISQGEGRNITTGNLGGYQYTSRLELLPFGEFANDGDYFGSDLKREPTPKLAVGATYDINNDAVKTRSNQGSYMSIDSGTGFYETNINTFFLDAMFKYQGFSLMAEYANRDAKDPLAKNSNGTLTGDKVQVGNALNLQSGYLFKTNWEISGRYTNITLDKTITGKGAQNQYTIGASKYIAGHKLKVQTDLSYLDIVNNTNQIMYRLQFDIHF